MNFYLDIYHKLFSSLIYHDEQDQQIHNMKYKNVIFGNLIISTSTIFSDCFFFYFVQSLD